MLRIAECDAALGHLVESAESYRAVVRTPAAAGLATGVPGGGRPGQAELAQVEPRVPKLVVQVEPAERAGSAAPDRRADRAGGAPRRALPARSGAAQGARHGVRLRERRASVALKERETRTLRVALKPISGVTYAPGIDPGSVAARRDRNPVARAELPPGRRRRRRRSSGASPARRHRSVSRLWLIFGLHLGVELPAGQIPHPTGRRHRHVGRLGRRPRVRVRRGAALRPSVVRRPHGRARRARRRKGRLRASDRAPGRRLLDTTASASVIGFIAQPGPVELLRRDRGCKSAGTAFRWTDVTAAASVPLLHVGGASPGRRACGSPSGHRRCACCPRPPAASAPSGPPSTSRRDDDDDDRRQPRRTAS